MKWIFEAEDKLKESKGPKKFLEAYKKRPTWKWMNVEDLSFHDKPSTDSNSDYLLFGKDVDTYVAMLKDVLPFSTPSCEGKQTVKFSESIFDKIFNTPSDKYINLDGCKYVSETKGLHVDEQYRWCTSKKDLWARKDKIRFAIFTEFIRQSDI